MKGNGIVIISLNKESLPMKMVKYLKVKSNAEYYFSTKKHLLEFTMIRMVISLLENLDIFVKNNVMDVVVNLSSNSNE